VTLTKRRRRHTLPQLQTIPDPEVLSNIVQLRNAWSSAVNSRLARTENAKFLEHFRYLLVASQLLNEYLDQGSLQPSDATPVPCLDGSANQASLLSTESTLYGAAVAATGAFALVWLISWARAGRGDYESRGRALSVLSILVLITSIGYAYVRRQSLKYLRQQAVSSASGLVTNWQALEVSSTSALQFIQEVELVSKGYKISVPMPPVSRLEENGASRRCGRLRKILHKTYAAWIPASIAAITTLQTLIDEDNLDKYFEVYDIDPQDAKEATGADALSVLEDDPESLKSLRVLSYRAGILRRITLCALMSVEADGGKPDFARWRAATNVMATLGSTTATCAEKLRSVLTDMETLQIPTTPANKTHGHTPTREKMRSQVRKISALSSGIRGLQAKMQILREETSRSIEVTDDLSDLGPNLMAQYDSIGADLKDLMQAWETGKASLQTNIRQQEKRLSLASSTASGLRSPVSSLGGLTAVDEDGSPADALRALNGHSASKRSSTATSPSEDGEAVFEAVAMPRARSTLTREERIVKMQEERERRTSLMAKRESNTTMLRELESVINLRPKTKTGSNGTTPRIVSM
jgi:hypothetical protein